MNQDDARNFIVALNSITGFVPPMMMQPLVNSSVATMLQAVANGQMMLVPQALPVEQSKQGEAGPPVKPHLVDTGGGGS